MHFHAWGAEHIQICVQNEGHEKQAFENTQEKVRERVVEPQFQGIMRREFVRIRHGRRSIRNKQVEVQVLFGLVYGLHPGGHFSL